ncbi:phosphoribosyltransferase [Phycisphaera mikurensis]|uniref:Hypoxanthine phosphoribosyltransferase n=1 Tax=Phycisphaera mikurensis (strain NBRC 102666 / KCTC 22515 / FYK2301M01) TaxID=1142394 RepID=I0IFK2_PHYMF|nr:phosphoribosyltransferase family protein [Phycisphaera mikurensis]MBB6440568.1 hypoxanthine phosphoribosyltransferase [Phycisphaera mikurensis]BAM04040.1 hypoxanthine phosphoribosyltransferase [Phycisphaera mikurensis NBRC 102666]
MPSPEQRVLIPRERIAARVEALAGEVAAAWAGKPGDPEITLVPVMTGAFIFAADLIRHLPQKMRIHLIQVRSYPGTATTSQGVTLDPAKTNVPLDLTGRHVLVIDDILDSGRTMAAIKAELLERGAAEVSTCVLLRKPNQCRDAEAGTLEVDHVAFDIPDAFVVGYGLDHDDHHRNLPDIEVLLADGAPARADAAAVRVPPAGEPR